MKPIIITLFLVLIFQGCSTKTPENQWEYNSSSAFDSYTKYFLIDDDNLAESDLERAVKYAKQSADLEQLARVYLGVCALNLSVEQNDKCKDYKDLEEFVSSNELKAYYSMLIKKEEIEQIEYLPKQYQLFVENKSLKRYNLAFESIKSIEQRSSQFIAANLIKDELNKSQINYLIKKASFYGYKKIVLYWLNHLYKIENDLKEKNRIAKKIKIMKN